MKRFISILFFLLIIIIAGALIIPSFIDWNKHKEKVISKIENYLQRDIDISGNLEFHILPQPEIILEEVSIANIEHSNHPNFMSFKKIAGKVKIAPLFEGRIEVDSIELIDPLINLEITKNGIANWLNIFTDKPKKVLENAATSIELNNVSFTNAVIKYSNNMNGSKFNIKGLNAQINAKSLLGPYNISGDMTYLNSDIDFNIKTRKYNKNGALPITAKFKAHKDAYIPNIKFNGIIDFKKEFDAQGELSLNDGAITALLPSLNEINFLKENSNFNAILEMNGNKLSLKDISGEIGSKGKLSGEISGIFYNHKKAFFNFNLKGKNLILNNRNSKTYIKTPSKFNGTIKFKGRNTYLSGVKIPLLDFESNFENNEWQINYVSLLLNDASKLRLSGRIKPLENSSYYKLILSTNNFKKFINILDIDKNNIIKSISNSGLIDNINLSAKINTSLEKIDVSSIKAKFNKDKTHISGSLNIDRNSSKPKFTAKLNLFNWDINSFSKKAKANLLKTLIASDAKFEITSKKLKGSNIELNDVFFNAEIKNSKLHINRFRGGLSKKESFDIAGNIKSLNPISGLDIYYNMHSINPISIAETFGINMPPMFFSWHNSNIKGHIKGEFKKYNFLINSHVKNNDILLEGSNINNIYNIDINIKNKKSANILKYMGVPVSSVFNDKGEFIFVGKLKGTGNKYLINNIKAVQGKSGFHGSLEKNKSLYSGTLNVKAFDIDKFIKSKFISKLNLSLNIKGKTLWGGNLDSKILFNKKDKIANFKGKIKNLNLNKLRKKIGFKGFSLGNGYINFDLKYKKNKLRGNLSINSKSLKLNNFNYKHLGKLLDNLKESPRNLKKLIRSSLANNGNSEFKNISAKFNIRGSEFKIIPLKLSNEYGNMNIKGFGNIKNASYKINSELSLKKPRKIPTFNVTSLSNKKYYSFDIKKIKKFIIVNNPPPVIVQSYVAPVSKAATALPPITKHKKMPIENIDNKDSSKLIGNILKSLEE